MKSIVMPTRPLHTVGTDSESIQKVIIIISRLQCALLRIILYVYKGNLLNQTSIIGRIAQRLVRLRIWFSVI
jgi:hypothetical protein